MINTDWQPDLKKKNKKLCYDTDGEKSNMITTSGSSAQYRKVNHAE